VSSFAALDISKYAVIGRAGGQLIDSTCPGSLAYLYEVWNERSEKRQSISSKIVARYLTLDLEPGLSSIFDVMTKEDGAPTTGSDKPAPSITLSIAQDDVKRVLDASQALAKALAAMTTREEPSPPSPVQDIDKNHSTDLEEEKYSREDVAVTSGAAPVISDTEGEAAPRSEKVQKRPLHEMVYEAAQQCQHPMLKEFLDKMRASGSSPLEVRAGIQVFHDLAMAEKIKLIFDVLGKQLPVLYGDETKTETILSRDGATSLFRSVIVAISSCIHQDKRVHIEIEKDTVSGEPPNKRRKVDPSSPDSTCDKSVKTSEGDSVPMLQSPSRSFDSSLGTLREEDDFQAQGVRKEFEDIAVYATDRLIRYCIRKGLVNKSNVAINFSSFEDWRKMESHKIAPWLALLDLARWKPPQRSTMRPAQPSMPQPVKKEPEAKQAPEPLEPSHSEIKAEAPQSPLVEENAHSPLAKPISELTPTANLEETPITPPEAEPMPSAPSPIFEERTDSRAVISFDFTGSMPDSAKESSFSINITESNLSCLHGLVTSTGLAGRLVSEVTEILMGASKEKDGAEIVPIERFHACLHQLMGSGSQNRLSRAEKDLFSSCFVDFFNCFDTRYAPLEAGEAFAKELAVGFCFLGAGNKSAKLAAGFEILESSPQAGLTTEQLTTFLRSYLTMLCGISLLSSSPDGIMKPKLNSSRRKAIHRSVENGSKWTMSHFLKTTNASKDDIHSFEAFASWYTAGGFNVAPWLELLDLKKLLSLVGQAAGIGPITPPAQAQETIPAFPDHKTETPKFMSPRTPHFAATPTGDSFASLTSTPTSEILFTFPLANQRSLVVLKEDAMYVRKVVDQLGLLSLAPDELWSALHVTAQKHPPVQPHGSAKASKGKKTGKSMPVDKSTFVQSMQEVIQENAPGSRKRSSSDKSRSVAETRDVLANFFQSYDLLQVDRVALNELMGGLTLLCGGKKSTKLAFAFGVFDERQQVKIKRGTKKPPGSDSLGGEELFLFLRSFLIVMFSCCQQSWDLSDDAVNRYIADTANMVTDDVMRYQWRTRKKDRVDFDEFGQWYNEGGFETAPWLELLDLKKWVLVDNSLDEFDLSLSATSPGLLARGSMDTDCPPAPPDDSMDPSFFDDDAAALMPMDSIDEMDLLLMQPAEEKENDGELNKLSRSFSYSPGIQKSRFATAPKTSTSLKFHLITEDDNGGYVVSVSQKRIQHLRSLLTQSGLCHLNVEQACKKILGKSHRDEKSGGYVLSKEEFDSAMRGVVSSQGLNIESQRALSAILSEIFTAFDYDGTGQINATEVACGFTVFCKGKKSDKLEYAFDVLDRARQGKLSQPDTAKYLRSFLTVLLNVVSTSSLESDEDDVMSTTSGMRCDRTMSTVARAVEAGSSWASSQAFRGQRANRDTLCFDEFAEWYTQVGYSNIPWLELLDLHKWVIAEP
jgi:Ca2+-binding EF-hand superfamily protein